MKQPISRWVVIAATAMAATSVLAQEIIVGVPAALTGPYAFVGNPVKNAIVLALEEANAAGALGTTKLKWIIEDDASEKGQAITLVNRMATRDKVLMILGPTSSIEDVAAAPVANDQQVAMLCPGVAPDITKAGKWSFKAAANPEVIMDELGKYIVDRLKPKTAVMVFSRDNDGQIRQKNVVRDYLKSKGVTIVAEEPLSSSETDFAALASKLASQKPDMVYYGLTAEQAANLIIQAKQAGLPDTVKPVAPPAVASTNFMKVGGKAVDGTILVADYFVGRPGPMNANFVAAYEKKYGSKPDNWAAVGYTIGTLAVHAIKTASPNPDRAKVRDALERTANFPVVLGNGSFTLDKDRNPTYGATVLLVKNGTFELAP
jgi:branched-chain amino acid transport system substrate-binding protein